jgi:hypothetical protein
MCTHHLGCFLIIKISAMAEKEAKARIKINDLLRES